MPYYLWISLNVLFLLCSTVYIWLVNPHLSALISTAKLFSQLALILFIINVNMYFIFLVIRKSPKRSVKVALAKMARKMMKSHIHIAVIATTLIVLHSGIMLTQMGQYISYFHPKMMTGYLGIIMLILTLIGGYRRHKKASGFRRRFHLTMALIFATIFTIHIFLPF